MKNSLLFFISHQPNPRFIKQINYLAEDFTVSVIFFKRSSLADLNHNIVSNVNLYEIAQIVDGKYLSRIVTYIKSIKKLRKLLKEINPKNIIINNVDVLFFLFFAGYKKSSAEIVLEISDLKSYTFRKNIISKIMRWVDTLILDRYIQKLIVTSEKFYDYYFKHKFHGFVFVLENKPLAQIMPPTVEKKVNEKLVIGVVGLLLDGKPHKTLFEYAKDRDDIEVFIYGKGAYEEQAKEYAKMYKNIYYFGSYDFFKDISKIYASIDLLYMSYDTTNNDLNIKLALPNKLYEAMYYKVPVITSKGTYLYDRIEEVNIGYGIDCCNIQQLDKVIESFKASKFSFNSVFHLIGEDFYLADNDYVSLKNFIEKN